MKDNLPTKLNELYDVVTVDELSSFLRVSNQTIYRLAKSGNLKSFKIGSNVLFLKANVLELIGAKEPEEEKKPIEKEDESQEDEENEMPDSIRFHSYHRMVEESELGR